MDQYIGKLLDNRYELLERIGTGGMAVVYKARCHRLNRLVAVKILKPELAEVAEIRRRFHDESQAVAMLSHPNIMAVYDVSSFDGLDYIVMELLDGITLKQYMQKKGMPLNWREALHFITQIMKALSHAHSRGIIHRDIKPQNIMVLRDGSVKVADFGIARIASAAQCTLTQEALGSVHYISPEQARGSRIDNRADIYSAGVVLYEMTTGRLPFEGDTPVSVAIQHINSIPLAPREVNPDIPEALEAINLKAMAHDMEKRYDSADAMLVDLEEFRKNPNINFEFTRADFLEDDVVDEPTLIRTGESSDAVRTVRGATGKKSGKSAKRRSDDYDDDDDWRDRDKGGLWPILLAIVALLAFFGMVGYFLWTMVFGTILASPSSEVMVPNLIGMTVEEVNRDISLGSIDSVFAIVEGEQVTSDRPAGQIVHQDPKPNEKKKGEKIIITVDISTGPEQILMPDVVGKEYRQALIILQDQMGLTVIPRREHSEEVPRDYVISTDPEDGFKLDPGQEVSIVISLGPEKKMVPVPDFTNQSIEWAMKRAEELKLNVANVVEKKDEDHEKGTVIFQSIPAFAEVEEGSNITFHISSGPTEDEEPTGSPVPSDEPEPSVSPTTTPEVTPTPETTSAPTPEPTEPVVSVQRTVSVNLRGYTESVSIRIEVGGVSRYAATVDPAAVNNSIFVTSVSGTGEQTVSVYVNDVLTNSYTENFSQ